MCLVCAPLVATLAPGACGWLGVEQSSPPHDAAAIDASASDGDAGEPDAASGSDDAGGPDASASGDDAGPDAAIGHGDGGLGTADASAPDGAAHTDCGNAVVEAGEQCDDGVASATCDDDCTFASCGDGVWNALAGEACDSGDRVSTCSAVCGLPGCRAGCTCEFYRGTHYMFCAEQLEQESARQACEEQGMRPVRIRSGTEQTFLRSRTQQASFSKFHLGATDLAVESLWVWDDGTVFWTGVADGMPVNGEFAAWAAGEPNAFVAGENCSEVQSMQGWNDCVCDLAKPFVCMTMRDPRLECGDARVDPGEACDAAGETASCDADCSPAVCGDGVVNAAAGEQCDDGATGQYCSSDCTSVLCPTGCSCVQSAGKSFALCGATETVIDAFVSCGRAGMTLARVESAMVDSDLRSAADSASIDEYWIGVLDVDQPDRWIRSDLSLAWEGTGTGTAHGYANFASGAPSGTSNQDCAAVLADGHWQDRDCSALKAYACEQF